MKRGAARGYRECANLAMGWIVNQPSRKKFMPTRSATPFIGAYIQEILSLK